MSRDFTDHEIKTLFKTLKEHRADVLARRDLAVYQLLNETGLRINEFAQTTKGDARRWLKSGRIYIQAQRRKGVAGKVLRDKDGQVVLNAHGKPCRVIGREDHSYILNQIAQAAVRELLAINEQQMRSQSDLWDDDCPLVVAKTGAALSVRSYQARLKEWAIKAGLPTWASPHCFRHTKAQRVRRASQSDDPFLQVAYTLGQSARASAMLYSKPSRQELEAEAERIESQRSGPRQSKRDFLKGKKS